MTNASRQQQRELDSKIADLPRTVQKDLDPTRFAAKINESLHQQFTESGLPRTASMLSIVANDLNTATAEFKKAANGIGEAYRGAVANTERSTRDMASAIDGAAGFAREAAANLSEGFRREYRISLVVTTIAALVLGILIGFFVAHSLDPPARRIVREYVPIVEPPPPAAPAVVPKHRK